MPRGLLAALAAVGLGAAIVLALHRAHARDAAPPATAAALAPGAAYARAMELGRAGRHMASVPYFRRALGGIANDASELHVNYAAALHNASLEYRGGALPVPATRASDERMAYAFEAMRELGRARVLTSATAGRARLSGREAEILAWWGFAPEALERYRSASREDPAWAEPGRRGDALARDLAHPGPERARP